MAKPVNVAGTALYNHTEGYGSYLIPAVMMVIIFQTLLMVIGMLTGDEYQHRATEPLLPGAGQRIKADYGEGQYVSLPERLLCTADFIRSSPCSYWDYYPTSSAFPISETDCTLPL